MKYFFTQGLPSSSGAEAHSSASVRHRIKVLIDAEPPTEILSDDGIVERLRGEGIEVDDAAVAEAAGRYRSEGQYLPWQPYLLGREARP